MRSTDHAIPNVVEFCPRAARLRQSEAQVRPANPDIAVLASSIVELQSRAKGEMSNAILMLDLAAQHARQVASLMPDPDVRKDFEEDISMIEQLLDVARAMALKL